MAKRNKLKYGLQNAKITFASRNNMLDSTHKCDRLKEQKTKPSSTLNIMKKVYGK